MRLGRRARQRLVTLALLLATVGVGGLAAGAGFFDRTLQAAVYDVLMGNTPIAPGGRVTIVAIDDSTIAHYGRWPLPRRAYADALDAMRAARPSVVAFDVGFYDPSDRPDDDRLLAEAIARSGNVVLGAQGQGSGYSSGAGLRYEELLLPTAPFRAGAVAAASVNVIPDIDGRVRRIPVAITDGDRRLYALGIVAVARHLRADLAQVRLEPDALVLPTPLGDRRIPLEGGQMGVYFFSPPATPLTEQRGRPCALVSEICVVPMADVAQGRVPAELLRDRVVLIGAHSASALTDDYLVPGSGGGKMFGVEIWANSALTILDARYPRISESAPVTTGWIALIALLGLLAVLKLRLVGLVLAVVGLGAYVAVAVVVFYGQARAGGVVHVPSIAYVCALAPGAWVFLLGYLLIEEQRAVSRTQRAFGHAVTPEVARLILQLEESGKLHTGGELCRATVLFGDIRGFTTMSEGMRPTDVLDTLNRYFEGMVEIVQRHGGTVNKYNGDNLMVIWGAPVTAGHHARNAVACALDLQRFVQAQRAKGGPDVAFGIGVNTGELVAGFLGAQGRFEYTVIGDTVNVAARLTAVAERDAVVASADTLAELGPDPVVDDLGPIQVKGRQEPIRCYRVRDLGPAA